ncbi:CRISPR-associated endonuclease Cas2 [Nesterenkonia alkaliphila]|uniref:CRISPR-associated endonuclease Cas2 n=1 Tax=Nesterenkonia alkaliphila TaxID=1463631 RepID=UPI0012F97DA3|nr:CRISPR-associated endonuclease Cas2 [Nesterenkonia alkaliphila]GFZ83521.1 hypothetical protein GCM10011359_10530 [Nesterenkonia alkaliphila]
MADPVWLLVMFDLPVQTKAQQKAANQFRNLLLDLGCSRVQFSVYARYFPNASQSHRVVKNIEENISPGGAVRIMRFSDAVWSSMKRFEAEGQAIEAEEPEDQLLLF